MLDLLEKLQNTLGQDQLTTYKLKHTDLLSYIPF